MRTLTLKMEVSVDGFVGAPDGDVAPFMHTFENEDEAFLAAALAGVWDASAHLMGRKTYEDMAAHRPTSGAPFAAPMNEIPKVVFSRTSPATPWGEGEVLGGDLVEEVARLKAGDGKPLLAHGGAASRRR
jgi:dihydrofolate reductase